MKYVAATSGRKRIRLADWRAGRMQAECIKWGEAVKGKCGAGHCMEQTLAFRLQKILAPVRIP
jgi:hypothetical protein